MIKKIAAISLITILLCGCSHKTEVRNKGFVKIIGCDSGETDKSAAIRLYGEDEVIEGSGESFFTAVDNAETTQGKTLFTGHLELLVLSPGEITDTLSVMIKNNRISPSCSLIITQDSAFETVSSHEENQLTNILRSNDRKGKIIKKSISEALNDLLEEDSMAAVPILSDDSMNMCITDGSNILSILSEEESEGLCWLKGSLEDLYIPVNVNGKTASFHVRQSSTRLNAESDGENIKITTEIKINGSCIENGIDPDAASEAAAERISTLCSKAISKTVIGLKADVIGIKKCVDSKRLAAGTAWNEIIPRLQFYYSIKITS